MFTITVSIMSSLTRLIIIIIIITTTVISVMCCARVSNYYSRALTVQQNLVCVLSVLWR